MEKCRPAGWFVYVVRCADGTLYTGITTDLARRIAEHDAGEGAKYTAARGPVALVYSTPAADRSAASRLEARIKRMTRAEKEALVRGGAPLPP